ncbi:unnamed protein product [Rangifer tarandus platyrhynchus]|uniref:Uncharacterized protein n=3 Tax=Rangifer tarandus platyrhynchus TaxID=3082113 RepID=A0ABN8ZGS1_RANTA|nr:unnamed protein product [Rangifer tarandus platyrhynchus]
MASFRLLLNDSCEGSRRHIILGHFPIPLFTLESERDRDAMITLFWPQRGPTRSQIRASSDTGSSRAVLLGSEKRVALGLGIQDLGTGRIQAPHQHRSALEAQSLDPAEEAVSCEALPPRPSISSRRSEIGGAEGSLPKVM